MIPKFDLHIPGTVEEVCALSLKFGPAAVIMAGGTDVIIELRKEGASLDHLIDISTIAELKGIRGDEKGGLDIGALVTHHEIERNPVIERWYRILRMGVSTIGSLQIRNRATLGGNICTAAPSADSIGPLLVLDAQCCVTGPEGTRIVPLKDFFPGPKRTSLRPGEILVRILVPPAAERTAAYFLKYGRRKAMEIALLSIAFYAELEADGKTGRTVRIALGTSAPTPVRALKTEEYLSGKDLTDRRVLAEAGGIVSAEARPRSSWRSSAEFRHELLRRLLPKAAACALDDYRKG